MGLVSELRRRNVFRIAVLYVVAAWLIMQVAEVLSALLPGLLPERFGQVTLGVLAVGFPIALVLSWFYEITPEGVSREKDVERGESITHVTGRRLDLIVIALMSAALLLFSYHTWWIPEPQQRSVAVLPFVPMTSGEDDGYFADGLTEEILNSLAQLSELQVTARTSVFFFKGKNIPVPEIADRLKVAHIVEGSVRRDGERLRITSQLIRAADGFHLWSQTYDRTRDDVFAVQQDIAEHIAEALNVVLDDNARQRMRNVGIRDVEAFIAYQKGLDAYNKAHEMGTSTRDWLAIANPYFDRALEAAPGLTVARIMRADVHAHILIDIANGYRDETYPGEAEKALAAYRDAYDLAVRLSPPGNMRDNLQLARILIGENWTGLSARVQKAMQPGRCIKLKVFYNSIIPFGWAEQVAEKFREILACDPIDAIASFDLALSLVWAGDAEEGLRVGDAAASSGVTYRGWGLARYKTMLAAGRVSDAMAYAEGWKWFKRELAIHRAAFAGDAAVARQLTEEYRSTIKERSIWALHIAAIAGNREWANEIAARIDASPGGTMLLADAVMDCLCGAPFDLEATPNYKARIEEAGFTWPPVTIINYPTKTW